MKLKSILKEIKVLKPNPFEPKTTEWWFYQLPEPYRTQSLKNFKNDTDEKYTKRKRNRYDHIADAMLYSFSWYNTPEGLNYWDNIFNRLANNEPLTEIKVLKPNPFEPKTTEWWFHQLPEPYRKQALTNFKNDDDYDESKNNIVDSLYKALMYAFSWFSSPEGYDYWNDIYYKLKNNEPLTEIKVVPPDRPKVKTIKWWLYQLPEPYRTQSLINYQNNNYYGIIKNKEYESLYIALSFAFDWLRTPEGKEYWKRLWITLK